MTVRTDERLIAWFEPPVSHTAVPSAGCTCGSIRNGIGSTEAWVLISGRILLKGVSE
ncbi:MAG: hypothetical protein KA054_02605 [Candidatus Moranbacteria bacterium]|nr:hypothetical protein [Candidatus Moranbacteria bacterium]